MARKEEWFVIFFLRTLNMQEIWICMRRRKYEIITEFYSEIFKALLLLLLFYIQDVTKGTPKIKILILYQNLGILSYIKHKHLHKVEVEAEILISDVDIYIFSYPNITTMVFLRENRQFFFIYKCITGGTACA